MTNLTRVLAALTAVGFSAADAALTLLGQPPAYWQGQYDLAVEANPLARPFLAAGPAAFGGLVLVWWAAIGGMLAAWRSRWAVRLTAGVVAAHGFGAAGWLTRGIGWPAAVIELAVAAAVVRALWPAARPAS